MFHLIVGIVIFIAGIGIFRKPYGGVGETWFILGIFLITMSYAYILIIAIHLFPKHHLGLWLGLGLPIFVTMIPVFKFLLRKRRISFYKSSEDEEENLSTWFNNIGKK